jgi:hypothetical protein
VVVPICGGKNLQLLEDKGAHSLHWTFSSEEKNILAYMKNKIQSRNKRYFCQIQTHKGNVLLTKYISQYKSKRKQMSFNLFCLLKHVAIVADSKFSAQLDSYT